MRELDALIAAGWGNIPQTMIPLDWRKHTPPKYYPNSEQDILDAKHTRSGRSKRRTFAELRATREGGRR